jgi:hypothetical protein
MVVTASEAELLKDNANLIELLPGYTLRMIKSAIFTIDL